MSLNVQVGDLVQCNLRAGSARYRDVREVLKVERRALIVAGGEHGEGRSVAFHDVLAVIPTSDICGGCFCRPCACLPDDAGGWES